MENTNWEDKRIKDLTLEDALCAYNEGVCFVCADGDLSHLSIERSLKNDKR